MDASNPLEGIPGVTPNPSGIGELKRRDIRKKVRVRKLGAGTGGTQGIVDSVTLTFRVPGNSFLFQIGIKPLPGEDRFSDFGDSGAVVVRGNELVGLLHGVTDSGRIAVASHMADVVDRLDITF